MGLIQTQNICFCFVLSSYCGTYCFLGFFNIFIMFFWICFVFLFFLYTNTLNYLFFPTSLSFSPFPFFPPFTYIHTHSHTPMSLFFSFYRMLPFLLTAFFLFTFIMSGSVSGLLVFVGILLSSTLVSAVSHSESLVQLIYGVTTDDLNKTENQTTNTNSESSLSKVKRCNLISLPSMPLSYLPLSTHTFAFVLGYLITTSAKIKLPSKWGAIVPLLAVLLYDMYYNSTQCTGYIATILLVIVSSSLGVAWAYAVSNKNWFVPHQSKEEGCKITDGKYQCTKTNSRD